jgi:hypothetical protein
MWSHDSSVDNFSPSVIKSSSIEENHVYTIEFQKEGGRATIIFYKVSLRVICR